MEKLKEVWKDIEGYEGIYQISNLGRVKSLSKVRKSGASKSYCTKEIIKKPYDNGNGYKYISLHKNKIRESFKIHRLVATHFISNPNNYPVVNHKDEDRSNNVINNLEWCTQKYNVNYGNGLEKMSSKRRRVVCQYTKDNILVKEWECAFRCSEFGYNPSNILLCCKGIRNTHKGFKWSYKN